MLTNFFDSMRRWRSRDAIRHQLAGLSDAQLRDIGITRADIDSIAVGNHPRVGRND